MDAIQSQINQELAVRDGLLKMKAAYEANPIMGDPHSVEGQMAENSQKLDRLKTELAKFQGYLDDVDGKPGTPFASKKSQHRNSVSESESLSRSASDSSFSQQNGSNSGPAPGNNNSLTATTTTVTAAQQDHHNHQRISPPSVNSSSATSSAGSSAAIRNNVTLQNHRNSNGNLANGSNSNLVDSLRNHMNTRLNGGSAEHSPESGISTSHLSIPEADYADADVPDGEAEFEDVLPVLGKARALYPFEAQSEGSIGMEEGEELEVVELDQGDGWTRVRKVASEEEGFVPTSYIEVEIAAC